MQHPWWFPVKDLTRHVLVYSIALVLFTLAAVLESGLTAAAERLVISKFTFRVLVFLEYAVVIGDAIFVVIFLIRDIWHGLTRALR
jgi:hypothetical protein